MHRPGPGQDRGRHQDCGDRRRDGVRIERLDPLAIRHHAADRVAGLKPGGARRRQRQHRGIEGVAERRQDVEGHIVPGVLLDIRRDAHDRAGDRDPLHLRPDHVPEHGAGAGFLRRDVDAHAGRRDAEHRGLRDDPDDAGGQRNAHDPAERTHVCQQPANDPGIAGLRPGAARGAGGHCAGRHAGASRNRRPPAGVALLSSSCLVRIMPA